MGMILLSAHKEREYVSMIASDDLSGWSYVLKQSVTDAGALVRAIEGAACGLVVMDRGNGPGSGQQHEAA